MVPLEEMSLGTQAIHAGVTPDSVTGAIIPPITLSTTFERGHEYIYSRAGNPNRTQLETAIAALEQGRQCIAYSSGMAAISSIISLLQPGDRVLSISSLYGGTMIYMDKILPDSGIHVDYINDFSKRPLKELLTPSTKLVWLETPTNPLMQVTDVKTLAAECVKNNVLLAVDNTFSSPIISQPLTLGAHFVVHSATKYLNGHADVTMGVVSTNKDDLAARLRFKQSLVGAVPSPFDCWLCHRGLKTIHLRVKQQSNSAYDIAEYLRQHPEIKEVNYPGTTKEQLNGGMLSFRMTHGADAAERLCRRLKLFKWAVSLGGIESLIEIPATALTHKNLPKERREELGIFEDLVRISVGCEEVSDLLNDLEQALNDINDVVTGDKKMKANGENGLE